MPRRWWVLPVVLGLVGVVVTVVLIVLDDVSWSVPTVVVVALVAVRPLARHYGRRKARDAGVRLRERRDQGRHD